MKPGMDIQNVQNYQEVQVTQEVASPPHTIFG